MNDNLEKREEGSGMQKDLESRADELEFMPETFRCWIERAQAPTEQGQAWREYTLLMVTCAEAFSRVPMTAEACDATDIFAHLKREIDLLLATMRLIAQSDER